MRRALAAAAAALALACASAAPPSDVDAARREALVNSDVPALRELFADGLRYGHANGEVHGKEELLGLLGSGRIDYKAIRVEDLDTQVLNGALVVTGRQTIDGVWFGRGVTSRSVFTAVYARAGGRWQLVAYQSAPVPVRSAAPSTPDAPRAP